MFSLNNNSAKANARARHLIDLLGERVRTQGDEPAFTFEHGEGAAPATLTWRECDARSRAVAVALRQRVAPGDRVLLAYPAGLDFLPAFFGCLYAGVVAVPVNLPRNARTAERWRPIGASAQARLVLTAQSVDSRSRAFLSNDRGAGWTMLDTDTLPAADGDDLLPLEGDPLAYLQYTSGSTETPRGVMIHHSNVLANLGVVHDCAHLGPSGCMVVWLPHFHDMGLINLLYALSFGSHCVVLSPTRFLRDPLCWLQTISRYRAALSGGPNFAFQLCADQISPASCAGLDLSCWQVAFCGAEPVRPATLRHFADRFASCGFSLTQFYPCYGLAESTLGVTGARPAGELPFLRVSAEGLRASRLEVRTSEPAKDAVDLVACGQSGPGHRVLIVDPATRQDVGEMQLGEIWAAGPSVSPGYWQEPEATTAIFGQYLASGDGPFLRTGDLGFLRDGMLYVTGRLKDLIIIRGRNHYPQDIEATVRSSHPALDKCAGVAFALDAEGEERLALAHEVERSRRHDLQVDEIVAAIQRELALRHEISAHTIVLVAPHSVPKTSSGKLQRRRCRELLQAGELNVLAQWTAPPPLGLAADLAADAGSMTWGPDPAQNRQVIQEWLVGWLQRHKGDPLGPAEITLSLTQFGINSLAAVELHRALETWLGRSLPVTSLWDYPTLAILIDQLAQLDGRDSGAAAPAENSRVRDRAEQVLDAVEQLSEEEVSRHLERLAEPPSGASASPS